MTTFDDREKSFEKKFALDEELKFRSEQRRNKLLGEWAVAKLGLTGPAVDDYVRLLRKADLATKMLALPALPDRVRLLNWGQRWVVERIDGLLARDLDKDTRAFLAEMRAVHLRNVSRCDESLVELDRQREVQVDRSSVAGIVRACIDRINGAEIHRLRVNPADVGIVGEYFRQSDDSDIEIVPDQSVAPGGAILHTSHGQLDARLESQLQEIEYGLIDR